ncbi:MAG: tetraacyldisaccharide 4'-kinase, partial [Bdellovibrionales bacterium]|nr:tetraacyldisaccharide 4'-kinase [Bdellovibrionales bacterium]
VLQSVQSLRDASTISSRKIAAFCALANPDNFFMMLKEQGYELLGTETFNDHHQFNEGDIHRLRKRFPEVPLVCTEKDATKLNTAWDAMLYVAAGSVSLGDEQKIAAAIETIIESKSNR